MLDPRLLRLTNRNIPRYTSYPTAPHFNGSVDADTYGSWLQQASSEKEPISLYLHVPFCRSICFYCGCATKASRRDEPLAAYANRLRRELAMVAERIGRRRVSHIHWGGGTPNLLPPDLFQAIVSDIRCLFEVDVDAEQAIELDPRHVTEAGARDLAAAGVTRASLGIQDFDNSVQEAVGRLQSHATVIEAIGHLRHVGIDRLNMDLIYGLPGQTVSSVDASVSLALAQAPARISLFGYAHVPWFRANQRRIDETKLPDAELRLALAETARERIEALGYVAVGIDHFARPDDALAEAVGKRTLRRNFQGYTTDQARTLIGIGASSVGSLPQGYVQNSVDIATWSSAIDDHRFAVERGRELTAEDRLRAAVIADVLCFFDVDLAAVSKRFGYDASVFAPNLAQLESLRTADCVRVEGDRLRIVRDGPLLARIVASAFDTYLEAGARHSMAV